ncbi:hypothetical protein TRP8649_03342 [Pelagimonas phthalicica]|uniref:Uncharacterized protein n=1 Tax=Pelagimonas phthalicica TaxID=1037362 RepID=A0A238JF02_9RHOB|nr:hypothetical protein [Pelagimonas phthalicica]SMX29209.1 hypothetical protein TRP8649_03342 [Pelagimonas phthalicica]
MLNKPSWPISPKMPGSMAPAASRALAPGANLSCENCRAMSRIIVCSSVSTPVMASLLLETIHRRTFRAVHYNFEHDSPFRLI